LPEKEALVIWIWFGSGPSAHPSGLDWAIGEAAARAGTRKATARILTLLVWKDGWLEKRPGKRREEERLDA
jgi:hypothetical protein